MMGYDQKKALPSQPAQTLFFVRYRGGETVKRQLRNWNPQRWSGNCLQNNFEMHFFLNPNARKTFLILEQFHFNDPSLICFNGSRFRKC